jgi:hypothetical protein
MNQLLAIITTNACFEKYCSECIRLKDCRPGTDEKRHNNLIEDTTQSSVLLRLAAAFIKHGLPVSILSTRGD